MKGKRAVRSLPKHSLRFNFIMNFGARVFGALCAAVSYPFVFRTLGAEGSGKAAFAVSILSFFTMFASLGLPTYGVRECAKVRDDRALLTKTVRELLLLQAVTTALAAAVLLTAISCVPRLREDWRLLLLQAGVLAAGAFNTEWWFAGMEQYGYLSLRSAAVKLLTLVLTFSLLRSAEDYLTYSALLGLGSVLPYLIDWTTVRRLLPFERSGFRCDWRRHIRPALMFFAQTAAITVYTSLDSAMLGFLSGDYWVGIYDAAIKVKLILSYFITSWGTVLMPRLSNYIYARQDETFRREIARSLEFTMLAGLPLTLFFFGMAPECVRFLFGPQFDSAAPVLRLLMPAVFLIGCSSFTGNQILTPTGNERTVMCAAFAGAAVDVALNLLFIPKYAAEGAAAGTLAAEGVVLGVQLAKLRKRLPGLAAKASLRKIIVAAAAPCLVLPAVKRGIAAKPFAALAVGAVCYFGGVAALLLWLKEPMAAAAWQRLRRRLHRGGTS